MTKQATIIKQSFETQTHRTGAPVVRKVKWLITDTSTGRLIDVAGTRKLAQDRARFAGYTI